MLTPRTIPNLLTGATLASAMLLAGAAVADPGSALDWPAKADAGETVSFGGDAMSADPEIAEGDGEPAPSPLSGAPATQEEALAPLAAQINTGPLAAIGATAGPLEES
ncbi:hypothetical protein [uncultured Albimonas sp.]|uniref:hypothetical protein n=1 Tax=uncultured Albimonas sp. TaxID=1331701 RepID=UPI0030ECED2B|tara:strand:+ start:4520 stop:4843 length:324 start_codon:yes stop_codon:yes gene_type:complete